jgi:CubicO group peptidase (beta-lactamase class C family)
MNYLKHFILLFSFFLTNSGEHDPCLNVIFGKIINAYTNEPISEVKVKILENGLETKTDVHGNFQLELGETSLDNTMKIPLSFIHEDYKPLEINVNIESTEHYKMVPDAGKIYVYNQPVQLSDDLLTGTLEDAEFDEGLIQVLMNNIYSNDYSEIHSVLIYKNNKLVLEEYFYGNNDTIQFENDVKVDKRPKHKQWARNEKHYIASVNKVLTSTLIGIALDLKGVSIKDKISPYLPQYSVYFNDKKKALLDFGDCLNMTAGFEWDEWESNDLQLLWKSNDFTDFVLSKPNMGTDVEWRYNSALPNLLLKALETLIGGSTRLWAYNNFYQKLGIFDYKWQSQPNGFPEGAARMYMRPRDMLKIGATYLNGGIWNKEQVIPKSWVEDCFTVKEKTSSGGYSNYFWHRELGGVQYLSADGDGGNYINIFPEQNMVIVITQGNYLQWPFYMNQANRIMEKYIIPAVK